MSSSLAVRAQRQWLFSILRCLCPIGLLLVHGAGAQKGIASLNDPCDCMQNHDYWVQTKAIYAPFISTAELPMLLMDESTSPGRFLKQQSCLYKVDTEEAHRPTALSDCIPGFIVTTIICMQGQLARGDPQSVVLYAKELIRLVPWARSCLDDADWPITVSQVLGYARRVLRVASTASIFGALNDTRAWPKSLLWKLAWKGAEEESPDDAKIATDDAKIATDKGSSIDRENLQWRLDEQPDTCPSGTLPDVGACWALSAVGVTCGEACDQFAMEFALPLGDPAEPILPRLLAALPWPGHDDKEVEIGHPWMAVECYVPSEKRMHTALPMALVQDIAAEDGEGPWREWSYPICRLVCPCTPKLPNSLLVSLLQVALPSSLEGS